MERLQIEFATVVEMPTVASFYCYSTTEQTGCTVLSFINVRRP